MRYAWNESGVQLNAQKHPLHTHSSSQSSDSTRDGFVSEQTKYSLQESLMVSLVHN